VLIGVKLARRVTPILLAFAASGALGLGASLAAAQPQRGATAPRASVRAEPVAVTARVAPTGSAPPPAAATGDAAATAPPPAAAAPAAATPPGPAPAPAPPPSPLNPSPSEFPAPGAATPSPDLEALMSRVTALRSRIAALGAALFASKLRIELRTASESVRIKGLRVSLDGGVVYTAPAQAVFEQPQLVYEHPVAAGPHVIAVELERQDLRQPEYSTWQSSRFVVVVPERRLLWTRLELEGDSTMGEDFAEDQAGRYELGVRLDAEVGD